MAEAQDRKPMAAKAEQESVLSVSLVPVFGFNSEAVCDWQAL